MSTAEPTYEGALYAGRRLRIEAACDQVAATIYVHRAVIGTFPHTPGPFAAKTFPAPAAARAISAYDTIAAKFYGRTGC